MMDFADINNLSEQKFIAPVRDLRDRGAEFITPVPEVNDSGSPFRIIACSCGKEIIRSMGNRAYQCNNCGRKFVFGEVKGDEQFVIS